MSAQQRSVYIALVHWPIKSKSGESVATSVTHFDIHDIARVSKAYGVKNYFIIHKVQEQLMYVSRVLNHWQVGEGSGLNEKRQVALKTIKLSESISKAAQEIKKIEGESPQIVATAARSELPVNRISFKDLRQSERQSPLLLLFGTGYGLADKAISEASLLLEPIQGSPPHDYRHLSVRSAVSICLDRLFGTW